MAAVGSAAHGRGDASSTATRLCTNYLDRLRAAEEAARHELAAIVYFLIIGYGQYLATAMRNLAIYMRRAAASGGRYELPRLAELLARSEFEPLRRTLTEWKVGLDELQAEIDEIVEGVRSQIEMTR